MNRRSLLIGAALAPLGRFLGCDFSPSAMAGEISNGPAKRVHPSNPGWPSAASWNRLKQQTGGHLIEVQWPLKACEGEPYGDSCWNVFRDVKNPYYIRDEAALTQTTGWVDAWTSTPSAYAVAARATGDVVAAVNFARENHLRLVVKGGGHSYLGASNAPDSLLIWTRFMDGIAMHDAFVAQGCSEPPQPAVTVGAGAIWMHTYDEVTTKAGRYVKGGGCGTVGVGGLVQGGGFGSYSKRYGTAAASLLEAEIVTADGMVRIATAFSEGARRSSARCDCGCKRYRHKSCLGRRLCACDYRQRGAAGLSRPERPRARSRRCPAKRAQHRQGAVNLERLRPKPVHTSRKAASSRLSGRNLIGEPTIRNCSRSSRNAIPTVYSSSITASAVKHGAPTASRGFRSSEETSDLTIKNIAKRARESL